MSDVGAVIAAAGSGVRLGGDTPKALRLLGSRTLLAHAVDSCRAAGISEIVVVAPAAHVASLSAEMVGVTVVAGGAQRQDSVRNGLAALSPRADIVLVHDAARALAPPELFARVIAAVRAGHDAVVPGLPVTDTIKVVDGLGAVISTPARETLRAIQTPQGFRRQLLEEAHAQGGSLTDDAGLVEALGKSVHVVAGERVALKITTAEDLEIAVGLL